MIQEQPVHCQLRQQQVVVTVMQLRQGRGAKAAVETRALACDHAAACPKSAFCRLVNPLTTRLPFDLDAPAPAPVAAAPRLQPSADHQAS